MAARNASVAAIAAFALAACGAELDTAGGSDAREAATETDALPDAETDTEETAAPKVEAISAFPKEFRGLWDDAGNDRFACSDLSDGIMRVEANGIQYYESGFTPDQIQRVSPIKVIATGTLEGIDESRDDTVSLTLTNRGRNMEMPGNDGRVYTLQKCEKLREVVLVQSQYEGTWAPLGACDPGRDDLIVITNATFSWQGKTNNFTKAKVLGPRSVELEHDGQDEPFGITLQEGGEYGMLSGPGHSGIPLTKC